MSEHWWSDKLKEVCKRKIKAHKNPDPVYTKVSAKCKRCNYWGDAQRGRPHSPECQHSILCNNEGACKGFMPLGGWKILTNKQIQELKRGKRQNERSS